MLEDDPGSNTALSTKVKRCANYIYRKPSNRKRLTRCRGMIVANEYCEKWPLECRTMKLYSTLQLYTSSRNLEEITNKVVSDLLAEFKILVMF